GNFNHYLSAGRNVCATLGVVDYLRIHHCGSPHRGYCPEMRLVVLDAATLGFEQSAWDLLKTFGTVEIHERTANDPTLIVQRCHGAQIVMSNKVPFQASTIAALPDLRLI